MNIPLKAIPIENGEGEPLQVCQSCFGGGFRHEAAHECVLRDSRTFAKGTALTPEQVKAFKKNKLTPVVTECKACGGAGMVRVHG